MTYVVDTHAIIWFLQGTSIGPKARAALRGTAALVIPTVVLAEIKYLKARGRIQPSLGEVMATIEEDPRFTIYPFDESVVRLMPTSLNIHDAIICGTALVYRDILGEDIKVVTKDSQIRDSGLVETVW